MADYDVYILGSPVHGGRISAPMRTFLTETDDLNGKSCILFVTHFFRHSWGADQALAEFTENVVKKVGGSWIHVRYAGFPFGERHTS